MQAIVKELQGEMNNLQKKEFMIVVMPHFCLDNLIRYGKSYESFRSEAEQIVTIGGGNLNIPQDLQIGGKAANCALALARLGLRPSLIARTNGLGSVLLENLLGDIEVDISHVKKDGNLAFTSSIELDSANIMISDPGSLARFGPDVLTDEDEKLITNADMVCISDWGLNDRGTELAKHVFGLVREKGHGITFFDPGDPSPKKERMDIEIKELIKDVIGPGLVDILSLNLEEAGAFGGLDFLRTQTRVDLHTKEYSRSFFGFRESDKVPAFFISPLRLTGAGDAWNAGDVFGELFGFSDRVRLLFANSVAAAYISDPHGSHPTIAALLDFLNQNKVIE
jgi:sugar/nucleoside kinase (ribokinase family)